VPRKLKHDDTTTVAGINLATITKGATSMRNTIISTAGTIQQSLVSSAPISNEAEEELSLLSNELITTFNDSSPNHAKLLSSVWSKLFPSTDYERVSPKWKEAGFQGNDPRLDSKQGHIHLNIHVLLVSQLNSSIIIHWWASHFEAITQRNAADSAV
jgi:ELMO/CED-12 family